MLSIIFSLLLFLKTGTSTVSYFSNGCGSLPDGVYDLKFVDNDDYPIVSVKCSNGYAILDYTQDNNIKDYFVSWVQWHYNTVGPSNEDTSKSLTWNKWFIPGNIDDEMQYIISPDCNTCDENHHRQLYQQQTTYWMTGTIYGCFWSIKGQHNCDVDWETDDCYSCAYGDFISNAGSTRHIIDDNSNATDYEKTGICPHSVQSANTTVTTTHDDCSQALDGSYTAFHLKPSLGIEGKYCVCVKPSKEKKILTSDSSIMDKKLDVIEEQNKFSSSVANIQLYQSDFESGTYRIQKPGTYTVMEDIMFHFNPNYDAPNTNRAWMPTEDQADIYPGADDFHDHYFMGFFAGIAIECDDIVLDLNGHILRMSEHFYYQQRWFTTIELSTQYFLPGQGIGNFGGNPSIASNVVIKNGVLGLTSHHGIHEITIKILLLKILRYKTLKLMAYN